MGSEPKTKTHSKKRIPAELVGDVEALLRRTLLLVGRLALKESRKMWRHEVNDCEQELAFALEELNDMQTTIACDSSRVEENDVET